jgi:hypothetical protein
MSTRTAVAASAALTLALATTAWTQAKEIPGERRTVTGTVEAIDHAARAVTIKDAEGKFVTLDVAKSAQKFDQVNIGDRVNVTYYDNVTVRLKQPGEKDVNTLESAVTPVKGEKPGATVAAQRTMTATVDAIDAKVPSITFTGPNGWKYSRRVSDTKALSQVKVGDRVDFTWTEAVLIDVVPKQ